MSGNETGTWEMVSAIGTWAGAIATAGAVWFAVWLQRRTSKTHAVQDFRTCSARTGGFLRASISEIEKAREALVRLPALAPGQSFSPADNMPDQLTLDQIGKAIAAIELKDLPWSMARNVMAIQIAHQQASKEIGIVLASLAEGKSVGDPLGAIICDAKAATKAFDKEAAEYARLGYSGE